MKFTFKALLGFALTFIVSTQSFAQGPQMFNYQAILRNGVGSILTNASAGLYFTIHDGSPNGISVYEESQNVATNQYGLFTVFIGAGNVESGNFSAIDWASGPKYLQVKVDITGGSNYVDLGTTQLISVPYSLHANTADTASFAAAVAPTTPEYAVYEERYPNTTTGSINPTNASWNIYTLNTTQSSSGTSISRNGAVITLAPGTYHVTGHGTNQMRGSATGFCSFNVRLKNITANNVALLGSTSEQSVNINASGDFKSSIEGYITVPATQTFNLEYWVWVQAAPAVIGYSSSDPSDEIFSRIVIQKVN